MTDSQVTYCMRTECSICDDENICANVEDGDMWICAACIKHYIDTSIMKLQAISFAIAESQSKSRKMKTIGGIQ